MAQASTRIDWIEQARGVGIILVVIGHTLRGLIASGVMPASEMAQVIDGGIYLFHMPLFFLLAGLTFTRGSARHDAGQFLVSRAKRLIWPLFLWTWIFFALQNSAGAYSNLAQGWADFPWWPLPPRLHFWFLWAMFLMVIFAYAVLRGGWPGRVLALTVVVAVIVIGPGQIAASKWFGPALLNLPYFILGLLLTHFGFLSWRIGALPAFAAFLIFAVAVGAAATGRIGPGFLVYMLISTVAVLALVVPLTRRSTDDRLATVLRVCGAASMAIYLAHTIFSGGARTLLLIGGVTNLPLHLIVGIAIGIVGPLVLFWLARRKGLVGILGF